MGVCYELVDEKNKRRFDLGKGPWLGLWDFVENRDPEPLIEAARTYWSANPDDPCEYMRKVMAVVTRFCEEADWKVYPLSDVGPDDPPDYPVVLDRYELDLGP